MALTCYDGPISMGLMKTKGIFYEKVLQTSKKILGKIFLGHPVECAFNLICYDKMIQKILRLFWQREIVVIGNFS